MRLKRMFPLLCMAMMPALSFGVVWFSNPEPAILEVHYIRTEIYDSLKRDNLFCNEETMLRIGNNMSFFCSVPRYNRDSLMYCHRDIYFLMKTFKRLINN